MIPKPSPGGRCHGEAVTDEGELRRKLPTNDGQNQEDIYYGADDPGHRCGT